MYYLFLLLFFIPLSVKSEVIYTPYYETDHLLGDEELEKTELQKVYLLESDSVKSKKYYSLKQSPKGMEVVRDDFIYTPFSELKTACPKKDNQEIKWSEKTIYQSLLPIQRIDLEANQKVFIDHLSVFDNKGDIIWSQEKKIFMDKKKKISISLKEKMGVENLSISFRVFLNQSDDKINFKITDNEGIEDNQITVTKKGYSKVSIPLSQEIKQYKMTKEKTTFKKVLDPYKRILKKEQRCQTREKKYRFQTQSKQIYSKTPVKKNYHLVKEEWITKFYRREKIILKDMPIINTPYILVDDFILETSFEEKDLQFLYEPFKEEGKYPITFSYRGFLIKRSFTYEKNVD